MQRQQCVAQSAHTLVIEKSHDGIVLDILFDALCVVVLVAVLCRAVRLGAKLVIVVVVVVIAVESVLLGELAQRLRVIDIDRQILHAIVVLVISAARVLLLAIVLRRRRGCRRLDDEVLARVGRVRRGDENVDRRRITVAQRVQVGDARAWRAVSADARFPRERNACEWMA